jgi:predicted negative regulator of RcsB-dependent stress response
MRFLCGIALGAALTGAGLLAQETPAPPAAQGEAKAQQGTTKEIIFKPFDQAAYEAHARKLGASDAQLDNFRKECAEQGVGRAADNLIRLLNPTIDAAVKLSQNGDPRAALDLTKILAGTDDKILQAHLRYHLARVFLDGDDPERAVAVLNQYIKENANLTPLDDEVVFFYGQALADVPEPQDACSIFNAFLKWFPNASERYRATAHQRVQELEAQKDSDLHTLADGMKKVTRELKHQKTDVPVQTEQKTFITELDRLIEMYQEMEKQKSGNPSGNQRSSGPASHSALVEGPARIGNLNKVPNVADRWGDMKDKDRKQIESEIQNGLPPHYKKLLEEYYKKLGTSGK